MKTRLDLHRKLCDILRSSNCYYNPPSNIKIKYPCIIYSLDDIVNIYANGNIHIQKRQYMVTVIDEKPDSNIVDKVSNLVNSRYSRHYVADGLFHDVFIITL